MTAKKDPNLTRSEALAKAWRSRKDYLGEDRKTSLFTSWRAKVYTKKGQKAGFPEKWKTFKGFKEEMFEGWEEGKVLIRLDPDRPYSKENCRWANKGEESTARLIKLTYLGETKTLLEWCIQFQLNYMGVRLRYFHNRQQPPEHILFGKPRKVKPAITDIKELSRQKARDKVSKMLSAYRCKDKKKGRATDLTVEFLLHNIISQPCSYCGDTQNVGCDRKDNTKGHTQDNVIPACYTCNIVRHNLFSEDEMRLLGEVIREIKKARKSSV